MWTARSVGSYRRELVRLSSCRPMSPDAGGGIRTLTGSPPPHFECGASAVSLSCYVLGDSRLRRLEDLTTAHERRGDLQILIKKHQVGDTAGDDVTPIC